MRGSDYEAAIEQLAKTPTIKRMASAVERRYVDPDNWDFMKQALDVYYNWKSEDEPEPGFLGAPAEAILRVHQED